MGGYYVGTAIVGIYSITETPSRAVESGLNQIGSLVFSLGMVIMGVLALVSLILQARRSEAVAVGIIAVLTMLHGVLILVSGGGDAFVTGFRLMYAPLMMIVWCHLRTQTVATRRQVRMHVEQHVRALSEGGTR